jgi:hypothetical protein
MEPSYDLEHLTAQARRWRDAAEQAPGDTREVYLSYARNCEIRLKGSIETPVIQVSRAAR